MSSIFKGTDQSVSFTTEPSGADVIIDGQLMGKTPLIVKLKKNKYDSVTFQKKGYVTFTRPLDKTYDPITLINVLWDSSTTDLITGAAYEYEPGAYYIRLEKDGAQ